MGHSIGVGGRDGDGGMMGNHWDSCDAGDDSTIGLSSGHLAQGVGLSLPLASVAVDMGSTIGIVQRRGGVADNRGGGDNGSVPGPVTSIKEGQSSSIGLTCGHLGQGVGLGLGLPLAVVDIVVKSGNSVGPMDSRDGVVEGDSAHLSHSGLGGVGDDTDVVKATLSQSIPGGLPSSDLGHGPGLGVSRGHHGQAELKREPSMRSLSDSAETQLTMKDFMAESLLDPDQIYRRLMRNSGKLGALYSHHHPERAERPSSASA